MTTPSHAAQIEAVERAAKAHETDGKSERECGRALRAGDHNRNAVALRAAAETLRRMAWRPIDDARKDRSRIMVWCPHDKNIYVVSWWDNSRAKSRWSHVGGLQGSLVEIPTHFMLLPEPPSE